MKIRKLKPNLAEIHQYVSDIAHITQLRDKSKRETEKANYTSVIDVMQLVLIRLNEVIK